MFLVFDLMRKGELFDYLTEKVALSEKETRYWLSLQPLG